MENNEESHKGVFSILPQELIVEIVNRIDLWDLRLLDATNTFWRQLIKKCNLWQLKYREMMSTDSVHPLAMNYLWLAEVERAQLLSTLIHTNIDRQMSPRVIEYITSNYKSYIKAIIKNKPRIYKDLEYIKGMEHLTAAESQLAVKLYWFVHQQLPKLLVELSPLEEIWKHLILPEQLQHYMTTSKNPALYWEDHAGERYFYNLALWIDKDQITLYCSRSEQWGEHDLEQYATVTGPFDVITQQFPLHMTDGVTGGEYTYYYSYNRHKNTSALFQDRQVLYQMMSQELSWKLDQLATNMIDSVNQSGRVTERELKVTCDRWSPEVDFNASSKHPKPAVIRCLRRMIYVLLREEIELFSTSVGPVFGDKEVLAYGNEWPKEKSLHSSHPEYWPLFLVEKAYYCCEPLSRLMLCLILHDDNDNILLCTNQLLALKIDQRTIQQVVHCFPHSK